MYVLIEEPYQRYVPARRLCLETRKGRTPYDTSSGNAASNRMRACQRLSKLDAKGTYFHSEAIEFTDDRTPEGRFHPRGLQKQVVRRISDVSYR